MPFNMGPMEVLVLLVLVVGLVLVVRVLLASFNGR